MNEYFQAGDNVELWTEASMRALMRAGFKNIRLGDGEISALGEGPFKLTLTPNEKGVRLEIETENPSDSGRYKQYVAASYNELRKPPAVPELSEPIGSPEAVKPDRAAAFKPAFPEAEAAPPAVRNTQLPDATKKAAVPAVVTESPEAVETVPFYKTDWFILLVLILIPPVGLILMWAFKIFDKKLRIGLTVFFLLYTVLWGWLLYLPFAPTPVQEEPEATQVEKLNNYWDNMYVSEFTTGVPPLMDEYESLYLNGMLVSETGLNRARVILPEVQALCTQVLSMEALPDSNPAYPVQQSVNAAAGAFNAAINAGSDALTNNDPAGLADTTELWNTAMNAFYQIDYIYDQALESAEIADGVIEAPSPDQTTENVTPVPTEPPAVEETPTEEPAVEEPVEDQMQEETVVDEPTDAVPDEEIEVTDSDQEAFE